MNVDQYEFDVALSFASEDWEYVEKVAHTLKEIGVRVFYDCFEEVNLWGKNLYDYLQEVYYKRSRYTIMFISEAYAKKLWTNHERKSAQAKAFEDNKECILPARFDDTSIPGLLPSIGYINLKGLNPSEFAEKIKQKVLVTNDEKRKTNSIDINKIRAIARIIKQDIIETAEILKTIKNYNNIINIRKFSNIKDWEEKYTLLTACLDEEESNAIYRYYSRIDESHAFIDEFESWCKERGFKQGRPYMHLEFHNYGKSYHSYIDSILEIELTNVIKIS